MVARILKRGLSHGRVVRWLVLGVVLAGVAAVVLTWRDMSIAQGDLVAARKRIQLVATQAASLQTPDGRRDAQVEMDRALGEIAAARRRVSGSLALDLARVLPGLRTQRSGLLRVIDDAATAADSGARLLVQADALAPSLIVSDGRLPVEALGLLEGHIRDAARRVSELQSSPGGLWWPVRGVRQGFNRAASEGSERLASAVVALEATRGILGDDSPRRLLVALQNNAEMRAQGMVLSYVVLGADDGRISVEQGGSVQDLALDRPVDTPLPPGTAEVFGPLKPLQLWHSVNATPDFAVSGRVMADMYLQATGQAVSGVIAIDVPGLAALLKVIGPVALEGVDEPISAESVARILLHDLYVAHEEAGDQAARRERLHELTAVVFGRLLETGVDVVALGQELGEAAAGGHLKLWSGDPAEQAVFVTQGLGNGPAQAMPDRTFHVAVENRTANKVDYFVRPSVHQRVSIGTSGDAVIETTITVENQAPVGAAPSYQLSSTVPGFAPGDYMAWVLMWAPAGSSDRDGGVPESGLVLSHRVVDVTAGGSRQVVFETSVAGAVRDGVLDLRYFPQPRLEAVPLTVEVVAPGWRVKGDPQWSGVLDKTQNLAWAMRKR